MTKWQRFGYWLRDCINQCDTQWRGQRRSWQKRDGLAGSVACELALSSDNFYVHLLN